MHIAIRHNNDGQNLNNGEINNIEIDNNINGDI